MNHRVARLGLLSVVAAIACSGVAGAQNELVGAHDAGTKSAEGSHTLPCVTTRMSTSTPGAADPCVAAPKRSCTLCRLIAATTVASGECQQGDCPRTR